MDEIEGEGQHIHVAYGLSLGAGDKERVQVSESGAKDDFHGNISMR